MSEGVNEREMRNGGREGSCLRDTACFEDNRPDPGRGGAVHASRHFAQLGKIGIAARMRLARPAIDVLRNYTKTELDL